MRLSTNMMFELGMRSVQRPQSEGMELQQRIASGRRVEKPSDDPVAAAAIVGLTQAKSVNEQYATNASNAQSTLSLESAALDDVNSTLRDIKTLLVKAGNPTLQNQDRASVAAEVGVLYQQLLAISNRTDGNDQYLFSGYQGSTQPFAESAPGVVAFSGDEGQRLAQIGPQRRIATGDSGADVFQRAKEGNGTFVTTPAATNAGNGVAGAGTLRFKPAWDNPSNSQDYTVRFFNSGATPPVITYDVIDNATNTSMVTGASPPVASPNLRTYQSGTTIDLQRLPTDPPVAPPLDTWDAGIQLDVSGTPASGDTFDIRRAQAKDIFSTVHDLVQTLATPLPAGVAARAQYDSALNQASASLDSAMDHILTITASVGVRSKELDTSQSTAEDLGLRYDQDLARLQDLDYAKALSDLAQKQFALEAAQKSYVAITSLKLFDFIK